jgi:hypothetical protein
MLLKSCQSSLSVCSMNARNSGIGFQYTVIPHSLQSAVPENCIRPSPLVSTAFITSWRRSSAFLRANAGYVSWYVLPSGQWGLTVAHLPQSFLEAIEV